MSNVSPFPTTQEHVNRIQRNREEILAAMRNEREIGHALLGELDKAAKLCDIMATECRMAMVAYAQTGGKLSLYGFLTNAQAFDSAFNKTIGDIRELVEQKQQH